MTDSTERRVIEPGVLEALSCALAASETDRRRVETAALFEKAISCEWIVDGARVSFAPTEDMARAVLDFVLMERTCCSRLSYQIESTAPHDRIALVLRGPAALVEAIRAWTGGEQSTASSS